MTDMTDKNEIFTWTCHNFDIRVNTIRIGQIVLPDHLKRKKTGV